MKTKKKQKFPYHYSGTNSEKFWEVINKKSKKEPRIYQIAVRLQEAERAALAALHN